MDGWLDECLHCWIVEWLDGLMYVWNDGMDGWLDGWIAGWLDRWMEKLMVG